jgi:DNA-directed RNA polymerase subunit alpha
MMILPKPPKIIDRKENWARFEIEGLYPGYGITMGNSLRRVLLSSLQGAAVTQVKIKGVQHEFSTMSGVYEDVITIIMNLKQMRFKLYSDEPQKAELKISGEKEVKGSDFKFPSQAELVNKSCHIATLTDKKSELEMEIQIERGAGYETVEKRRKDGKLEVGSLPVDAIFIPIVRVSYRVENMRVGKRTDFDRLFLDIETDGTITPEQAFSDASNILVEHFSLMAGEFSPKVEKTEAVAVEEEIPVEEKNKEENVAKKEKKEKKNKKK